MEDIFLRPKSKPKNPCFGSGPSAKPPLWSPNVLKGAAVGRSHRSLIGIQKIRDVLALMRQVLDIPSDYHIAIVAGSATGAMEMLLWNLLGARLVEVFAWDVFGWRWAKDIQDQLKLTDLKIYENEEEFEQANFAHDVVFTWNGSVSGACLPQDIHIPSEREGLTLCDATSSAFAMPLPWKSLDAVAFSWQKGLGGEAGQGIIVLGPRALTRLESYGPPWPIPYLYKLADNLKINQNLFTGITLNTPSLLAIEDALYSLRWAKEINGIEALYSRTRANFATIEAWVKQTPWIDFLAPTARFRSMTTVCLKFPHHQNWPWIEQFCQSLAEEEVAYDIKNHKDAPPSIRIWTGPTIETSDVEALLSWLEWAYQQMRG